MCWLKMVEVVEVVGMEGWKGEEEGRAEERPRQRKRKRISTGTGHRVAEVGRRRRMSEVALSVCDEC